MKLWKNIPIGESPPEIVNAVIEVISFSRDKYEYSIEWDAFVLDRTLHSSAVFPVEYGFIPQTWYYDNDPLDIMVLSSEPTNVGCIIKSRVIGVMIMEDEKGDDPKILAVPINDPRFEGITDIKDIHENKLKEIQDFFEIYKRLDKNKYSRFKAWKNADVAKRIIEEAIQMGLEKKRHVNGKPIIIEKGNKRYVLIPK